MENHAAESPPVNYPPGTAPVKAEYLISRSESSAAFVADVDDDAAEGNTGGDRRKLREAQDSLEERKDDGRAGGRKDHARLTKAQKKAQRGQNKGRKFGKVRDDFDLCWKVANGAHCEFGDKCRFTHDIPLYLLSKPVDIHIPLEESLTKTGSPPYAPTQEELRSIHPQYPSIDVTTVCPVFAETGECRYGFKCRFLGGHIRISSLETDPSSSSDYVEPLSLTRNDDKKAHAALTSHEMNFASNELLKQLRSRKYPFPIADAYLGELGIETTAENATNFRNRGKNVQRKKDADGDVVIAEPEQQLDEEQEDTKMLDSKSDPNSLEDREADDIVRTRTGDPVVAETKGEVSADSPDARVRFAEKRRLEWTGKTYLAPLTTVGNLPFRRLCVNLGADITCGEMALAPSFLSGSKEEWSLVRRHPSEKIFGVQVAGNRPANLVPAAEALAKELGSNGGAGGMDFVDVNCGCPIDLVFKSGSGSALLDNVGKLGKILVGMNRALGDIPLTVKLRTGVKDGKNTAHKLMPRLSSEWGIGCMTLHGRTRQQRYTRQADWDYIKQCVEAVRAKEKDDDLPTVPIFGGGDCFSSADYYEKIDATGVDGVMIGRGALIKPWIFTEIKEKREWDISSTERLEWIRKYAEYGLNHFGSDTAGVNTTRRYLCEALSFQYRYIPIGLLERLPGRINDRAPAFTGRNELETLLSSPDSNDWVKISEMFLGPPPETWSFTPKHKSNAYGSEEGQG